MTVPWLSIPLIALADIGRAISLLLIGGGLLWLFVRALRGKEVKRQVIFVFIFLAVAAPLLFPITFEEQATPVVKSVYDRIDNLPTGSLVLMSFDFDPAMAPEVQPMADAITRHAMLKNHRVIFMSLWATGQALLTQTLTNVVDREFPDKQYGIDYANLGYKAGAEGVLNVIITDLKKMFPTDVNNVAYDRIPVLHGVQSVKDAAIAISIGGGKPGLKEWILFIGDPGHVPIAGGVAAVVAPEMYPYFPKQLVGILGGIKGAAEYESELRKHHVEVIDRPTPGLKMMGPQTLAHIVIITFIIIGNFSYFVARRRERKGSV